MGAGGVTGTEVAQVREKGFKEFGMIVGLGLCITWLKAATALGALEKMR